MNLTFANFVLNVQLVRGPVPTHMTHQFKTAAHLPLSKQFEAIKNQARFEAIADTFEHPVQTVTLAEITQRDITLEIYMFLKDFENKVGQNKQEATKVMDSGLKHQ